MTNGIYNLSNHLDISPSTVYIPADQIEPWRSFGVFWSRLHPPKTKFVVKILRDSHKQRMPRDQSFGRHTHTHPTFFFMVVVLMYAWSTERLDPTPEQLPDDGRSYHKQSCICHRLLSAIMYFRTIFVHSIKVFLFAEKALNNRLSHTIITDNSVKRNEKNKGTERQSIEKGETGQENNSFTVKLCFRSHVNDNTEMCLKILRSSKCQYRQKCSKVLKMNRRPDQVRIALSCRCSKRTDTHAHTQGYMSAR